MLNHRNRFFAKLCLQGVERLMKRTALILLVIAVLCVPSGWFLHQTTLALQSGTHSSRDGQPLVTTGRWSVERDDLVYIVAFSSEQQPNGPLVVYRAPEADARAAVPVIAIQRGTALLTPLLFPSPDGRSLVLLTPLGSGYNAALNGASLRIFSSDGGSGSLLLPGNVAAGDTPIWSADSRYLYYHSGSQQRTFLPARQSFHATGYDEIHRVDLTGHDVTLYRQVQGNDSLRLIGIDRTGALIMALARPKQPVALLRFHTGAGTALPPVQQVPTLAATLPSDMLPGNILRIGSDGSSVECERVLSWHPLRYTLVNIPLSGGTISASRPLFNAASYGPGLTALARSADGQVLVMAQVLSTRADLAAQGIANVPVREALLLANARTDATQRLMLPNGGQIVQAFWMAHVPTAQIHSVPSAALAALLTFHKAQNPKGSANASVFQQDEWMLEGHNGLLSDAPKLPKMCYGTCAGGPVGPPHVSAAILHGVAYIESDWHQFNAPDFRVGNEVVGSPVKSFDGGWGEYQQTWGMPPQCQSAKNCRGDASRIQNDQSYNIGTGIQALIYDWNGTVGVASSSDPNDPFKANHWFFAVWAYNGSYGNNPNDVPTSTYGHWYPGAPFRTVYEEYVWYFAAHPQYSSNGWTDNYLPSLGSDQLPPQADFSDTSDSFVFCYTCSIPDWTPGSFDRDWVGSGAPDATTANLFTSAFSTLGENVMGLPRDNGGGAAVHAWGSGLVQDFGGGSELPGALMLATGTSTAYRVYGGIWTQYLSKDRGARGCHGYPTSSLVPYTNRGLGPDTYLRQTFQQGAIIWDATKGVVAKDICS